jgi:hypothetical protein
METVADVSGDESESQAPSSGKWVKKTVDCVFLGSAQSDFEIPLTPSYPHKGALRKADQFLAAWIGEEHRFSRIRGAESAGRRRSGRR